MRATATLFTLTLTLTLLLAPAAALATPVDVALRELEGAYRTINNDLIGQYRGWTSTASKLEVRIEQSGRNLENFLGNTPGMSTVSYSKREALTLLPDTLVALVNARILRAYGEGYDDYRQGYEAAQTTNYDWMTREYVWNGIWLVKPFSASGAGSSDQAQRRLNEARDAIKSVLQDAQDFLRDGNNFETKTSGWGMWKKQRRYMRSGATRRWHQLKQDFNAAMRAYRSVALGLVDAAKAEAQRAMATSFRGASSQLLVLSAVANTFGRRNRGLTVKAFMMQQMGAQLYYMAEALVSAAYRAGYNDAKAGSRRKVFTGYDTKPGQNYVWGDDYDTEPGGYDTEPGGYDTEPGSGPIGGGRIYSRGRKRYVPPSNPGNVGGDDYYGGLNQSDDYDTTGGDGYGTTGGDGYGTTGGDGYDSQPGKKKYTGSDRDRTPRRDLTYQCKGYTKKGPRCKNAVKGGFRCHIHRSSGYGTTGSYGTTGNYDTTGGSQSSGGVSGDDY